MSEQERFDKKLLEIADELGVEYLVTQVPDVYSLVSEHLNNDVLKALKEEDDVKKFILVGPGEPVHIEDGEPSTRGVLGILHEDNVYITAYAQWHEDSHNAKTIEVGERAQATYRLSGEKGTYDVVRVR